MIYDAFGDAYGWPPDVVDALPGEVGERLYVLLQEKAAAEAAMLDEMTRYGH